MGLANLSNPLGGSGGNGSGGSGSGDVTKAGNNAMTGNNSFSGADNILFTAMPALSVIFTKAGNTYSASSNPTFTYSNSGAPVAGDSTLLEITADGTDRTITIPSTWSLTRSQNITTLLVPANSTLLVGIRYLNSRYEIYGDPPATVGSGSYVLDQLGENAPIKLVATLSADGKYSGIVEAGTAGTTLAFGDLVYLQTSDSRWELTDADADATSGAIRIGICVLAAAGDGSATTILTYGKIRADAAFPTFTIGAPVYVSTTAGDVQVAQPSGTDDVIRIVGYGSTADVLFFNPSNDYITHT